MEENKHDSVSLLVMSLLQTIKPINYDNEINCFVDLMVEFSAHSTGAGEGIRQTSVFRSGKKGISLSENGRLGG